MSADGPEQREADRLERDTYDHDVDADRADEQRSSFSDSIFEFAKSQNSVYRTAYDSGYNAGYAAAMRAAIGIIDRNVAKVTK